MAGSATSLLAGVVDHRKGLRLLAMGAQTERPAGAGQVGEWIVLKRDDFSSNRHLAPSYAWSMIFSENRYPARIKSGPGFFGIMLQVLDPAHRPRRIASKRCAKVASGFGHISSSSTGGAAGSVGIVTITGSLANGSKPVVAFTGSAPVVARTGSPVATAGAGSVLATARTGLMTRARAGAPAFSGPYQQRLPCAMRYCQWPARSDAGGKVVRHSGNAGSTEHITLHASTAANAARGIQPSIPSRFACLWRNAFAPVGRMAAAG